MHLPLTACFFVMMIAPWSHGDVVHRRAGMPSIEGHVVRFDDAGITIERDLPQPEFIRWDFVRDFQVDRRLPELDAYRQIATNLWRARTRLERHDPTLAEPIFERLFERYRGQSHETALLVAEGLLRCRLMRGANDGGVIAALEAIRIRRAIKPTSPLFAGLPPIFDDASDLCIDLPPVWVASPSLPQLERELAAYDAGTDTTVVALANLYLKALRRQLGIRQDQGQKLLSAEHPGVAFLAAIVDVQDPSQTTRSAAREALLRDIGAVHPWKAAWIWYFTGASLLAEPDPAHHDGGMVNLAHLPARYGDVQPYLTGLALVKLAEACDAAGESAAAASLRNELLTRFPQHPALNPRASAPQSSTQHAQTYQQRAIESVPQRFKDSS